MKRRGPALAGVLAAALFSSCCSGPCHQGHSVVRYHPEHTTTTYHKVGESSFPVTTRHPAHCSMVWVCDVSCKTWDTGSAEAHAPHRPHRGKMVVSEFCEMDRNGTWRVKS